MGPRADLLVVDVEDGGLLLNLETGVLFQLNGSGAFVWKRIVAGEPDGVIADALARRYGLAAARAAEDVEVARAMNLAAPATHPPLSTDFNYERTRDGFLFSFRGAPALLVDHGGDWLTSAGAKQRSEPELAFLLQAIVPKVAALRGGMVLHASAFVGPSDELLALSGPSGAGKTTTARAVAEAGARLVSEDKLVLSVREGEVAAHIEGEARLTAWVTRGAKEIAATGRTSCADIDAAAEGPARPLGALLFIDANRRSGGELSLQPLEDSAAAAEVFHAVFYGSDRDSDWRRMLSACAVIGESVPTFTATMPAGLAALRAAASSIAARRFGARRVRSK